MSDVRARSDRRESVLVPMTRGLAHGDRASVGEIMDGIVPF